MAGQACIQLGQAACIGYSGEFAIRELDPINCLLLQKLPGYVRCRTEASSLNDYDSVNTQEGSACSVIRFDR